MNICIYKNQKNGNRLTMVSFDFPAKGFCGDGFYKYLN